MERINDTHYSYPRTLEQAFGPYTDNRLQPMRDKSTDYGTAWWVYICIVSILGAIAIVFGQ